MSRKVSPVDISTFPYPPGTPGADFKNNGGKYIHNLSPANKAVLDELAAWVVTDAVNLNELSLDILNESLLLLRYLRANNFNIKKTKKHMVTNIEWRKSQGIPELMKQDPEAILGCKLADLVGYFPHWHYNYDKTGRPLLFKQQGAFDMKVIKAMCGGTFDRMFRYHVWEQELMSRVCYEQSLKTKTIIETVTVVLDVKGIGMSSITSDFRAMMNGIIKMDQDMYPETLGKILVVNAPSVFPMIFGMIKPWLDPITAAKVNIKGSEYKALLADNVGLDNLPSNYHGTLPALNSAIHPYAEAMGMIGESDMVDATIAALANVVIHEPVYEADDAEVPATVFTYPADEDCQKALEQEEAQEAQDEQVDTPQMTDGSVTPTPAEASAEEAVSA